MTNRSNQKGHSFLGVALCALAVPAAAQDASPVSTVDDPQGFSVAGTDVVVTATRRETNLQETPIAISVVDTAMIEDRHVQSLVDLADGAVPSLRVAPFESRTSALTIGMRGIVPLDANQPAREQGVGVYIDGVYLGRQHGLNAGLLDVERIEVLRGPQGTLFGRNTEGGAVNIVTAKPSGTFGGRVSAGVGNFGSYSGALHIDLPEIANIAFKVDAVIQHQEATVDNPLANEEGWNAYHRYGGRIAARWRPSADFTADIAFDIGRDENTPMYSQLINYNPRGLTVLPITTPAGSIPPGTIRPLPPLVEVSRRRVRTADVGVPQNVNTGETIGIMSALSWRATSEVELRSITAYREVRDDQWDNSGGPRRTPVFVPNGNFSRYSLAQMSQHQFSQELQALGRIGGIDYVAGLYYFNETAEDEAGTANTNRWNADGTGFTINDPTPTLPGFRSVDRASRATSKSYAIYGQATWTPPALEQFHLTLGGRFTRDEKEGTLFTVNNIARDLRFDIGSSRFDPMATLAYDVADDIHVYAKYATGYRSGGASSRSLVYRSFGPESVKSYEVGAKTFLFDRLARLNVAGYIMDRNASQIDFNFYDPVTNRNTLETVNAPGTTRIRGVETELTLYPMPGLTLNANYTYTYAKIPPTPNPLVAGNPIQPVFIVFTPPHAASGSIAYEVPAGAAKLRFYLDANYSDRHHSIDNEDVLVESSILFNGRIALVDIPMRNVADTRMTISIWARNLFNEEHIYRRSDANGALIGDYANFNTPRTFGAEVALKF